MGERAGMRWLTAEDLERERAYVRNLRFGPPEPLWRRALCHLLHRRHHGKAALDGRWAAKCARCGNGWAGGA